MSDQHETAPILVFAYGNPSRGDDAIGTVIFNLLEKHKQETSQLDNVDLLTDFQLQIEHAVDLEHRRLVLFIDANVSCAAPFEFQKLQAEQDDSYTTHAMSPAAVLAVYQKIHRQEPPPAYMLSIRGYEFGLGQEMTEQAKINIAQSYTFIIKQIGSDTEGSQ